MVDAFEDLCDQNRDSSSAAESPPGDVTQSDSGRTYLLEVGRRAMACDFQVVLNHSQYENGAEAAVEALDLVEQLEAQLSVYRDQSEVGRLNRTGATRAVPVEEQLFQLLWRAVEYFHATNGAFDITAGPLAKAWGFFRRQGHLPDEGEIEAAMTPVGADGLLLCPETHTVQFRHSGMEINLGGIGKGHALDRAGDLLQRHGIESFLLHGGQSSILAHGRRIGAQEDTGWRVGLTHPLRRDTRMGEITLVNQALGTSGTSSQYFHHQGKRYCHVIDPRTGWPATDVLSTTVVTNDATSADALSTAFSSSWAWTPLASIVSGIRTSRRFSCYQKQAARQWK